MMGNIKEIWKILLNYQCLLHIFNCFPFLKKNVVLILGLIDFF